MPDNSLLNIAAKNKHLYLTHDYEGLGCVINDVDSRLFWSSALDYVILG